LKGELASPTGIDFITQYCDPQTTGKWRTPKHEHVIADILAKGSTSPNALGELIKYFRSVLGYHHQAESYPTINQVGKCNPRLKKKLISSITDRHLFHIEN
jgi:hypothetical protein